MRDNLADTGIRDGISHLCKTLYRDENSSILIFLTHQSKDPFIVKTLLEHSKSVFPDFSPTTFSSDTDFFKRMSQDVKQLVLNASEDPQGDREERLKELDSADLSASGESGDRGGANELISQLNLAFKTLDVLGQLIKNFPGSLIGSDKLALVSECYDLGLRTLSCVLSLFEHDSNEYIKTVMSEVSKKHKVIHNYDLENRINKVVVWMMEVSCFGMIKRVSLAVGHPQLGETYRAVLAKNPSNAIALVDVSTRLENVDVPEKRLIELANIFRGNALCERLLKYLVIHHMYMFSTPLTVRDRICDALAIPVNNVKSISHRSASMQIVKRS